MGTTGRKAAVIMRQVAPKIAKQIMAPHKLIMMDDGTIDQCNGQRGGWVGRRIWIRGWKRLRHNLDWLIDGWGVNQGSINLFHQKRVGSIGAIRT